MDKNQKGVQRIDMKNIVERIETTLLPKLRYFFNRKRWVRRIIIEQIKYCDEHNDEYYTLYTRPKYAEQVVSVEKETDAQRRTAIIMQGPLIAKDDLTLETVKIYEKLYPGTTVIVSTWEGEDPEIIEQLRKLRSCEVLVNRMPEFSGVLNLNYQVVSTMAGLKRAKELGKEYAFKTRCDFRFLRIGLINYFVALCKAFPVDATVSYQKQRIIVGGDVLASYFRAHWVSDRFSFGTVEDMLAYWDYELDKVDQPKLVMAKLKEETPDKTWKGITEAGLCAEPRIIRNYIMRMEGKEPECTVKKYWELLKKQFITLSPEETGASWQCKAHPNEVTWKGIYYGQQDNASKCLCYNWDFTKWFLLYKGGLQYRPEYELFQKNNSEF